MRPAEERDGLLPTAPLSRKISLDQVASALESALEEETMDGRSAAFPVSLSSRADHVFLVLAPILLAVSCLAGESAIASPNGTWRPVPASWGYAGLTPARYGHAAAYDALRRRMVVYGGAYGDQRELVTLDLSSGNGWTQVAIPDAPFTTRVGGSILYDPKRDRFLVYGGTDGINILSDDVTILAAQGPLSYLAMNTAGTRPPGRLGQLTVYDPIRDRLIVFGGYSPTSGFLNDLWTLSLSGAPTWTPLSAAGTAPSPRDYTGGVYDRAHDRIVFFGGNVSGVPSAETWELTLSATPAWNLITPVGSPPPGRFAHVSVVDTIGDRMIVNGGYDSGSRSDTWSFDLDGPGSWSPILTSQDPIPPRHSSAGIFDPVSSRMILSGGRDEATATQQPDTPVLELASSTPQWRLQGAPMPKPRYGTTLVYDPGMERVILFDGYTTNDQFPDNYGEWWQLDLSGSQTWSLHYSAGNPLPLQGVGRAAVVDSARARMLIVGGYGPSWISLFSLDLVGSSGWTQIVSPGTLPPGRSYPAAVIDTRRDRLILFGGNGAAPLNDLWALPLAAGSSWQPLAAGGTPPSPRFGHSAVYDAARDRVLVFGGIDHPFSAGTGGVSDLWELTLDPAPQWHQLQSDGFLLTGRGFQTMTLDPTRDRLVLYGGTDLIDASDQVWTLPLAHPDTWTQIFPSSAGPPPLGRFAHAAVYDPRRDRIVVYGGVDQGQPPFGDTWYLSFDGSSVSVAPPRPEAPGHIGLAVRWVHDSPGSGPLMAYSLETMAPASLEVFDVMGRLVERRVLTPTSSGETGQVPLFTGSHPSGLYLVRLLQSGHQARARAIALR
jgi:hypothetical protein